MSRQAVTKHLRILEKAGLIRLRKQGRSQYCKAHLNGLKYVTEWVQKHQIDEAVPEVSSPTPTSLDDLLQSAHRY